MYFLLLKCCQIQQKGLASISLFASSYHQIITSSPTYKEATARSFFRHRIPPGHRAGPDADKLVGVLCKAAAVPPPPGHSRGAFQRCIFYL